MSEQSENEKALMHKFPLGYTGERMPGKENAFILRNRQGFIAATAEKHNGVMTSFKFHKERRIPRIVINKIVKKIMETKTRLSAEAAHELGISILKFESGKELYLTSKELKHFGLNRFLTPDEYVSAELNSLGTLSLKLSKNTINCRLDLQRTRIKSLHIGKNSSLDIDLRGNKYIKKIIIDDYFGGKLILSDSSVEILKIGKDCRASITCNEGIKIPEVEIKDGFQGTAAFHKLYLKRLKIGEKCSATLNIDTCICYAPIKIGANAEGNFNINSVFAKYLEFGNDFSGKLYGSSISSRQGIRNVYIGDGFSGTLDLSASKTVQRVEIGDNAVGTVLLISTPSVRLASLGKNFSGRIDFRESNVVYISAEENCSGKFECGLCRNLTLMRLPKENGYKISGAPKPVRIEQENGNISYWFVERPLENEYFKTYRKSFWRRFQNFFS